MYDKDLYEAYGYSLDESGDAKDRSLFKEWEKFRDTTTLNKLKASIHRKAPSIAANLARKVVEHANAYGNQYATFGPNEPFRLVPLALRSPNGTFTLGRVDSYTSDVARIASRVRTTLRYPKWLFYIDFFFYVNGNIRFRAVYQQYVGQIIEGRIRELIIEATGLSQKPS